MNILLPVGISFYTFHTITYIVDSYRRTITPTRNLFEFSAYVSLFSQLVAGPIVRFRQIEDDLNNIARSNRTRWMRRGVSFFIVGLAEKVVVADTLAAFVDPALATYGNLSTAGAWLACLGYTFQLYFDFAGYSDMAVGLGFLFGIRIPQNFNSPYKALDPSDFWRQVAHLSIHVPAGLSVHPARRQPPRRADHVSQPADHHAGGGAVAWSKLDFCCLGRVSRAAAGALPSFR